jgi:hypothetical protein
MRKNDGYSECANILLPLPPLKMDAEFEMEVYVRFMRCMRHISNDPQNMNILMAIQFVADMMQISNMQVSKTLVDLGLRAPRMAFPEDYLELIDQLAMREMNDIYYSNHALRDLRHHWQAIREEKFLCFGISYPTLVGRSA